MHECRNFLSERMPGTSSRISPERIGGSAGRVNVLLTAAVLELVEDDCADNNAALHYLLPER
jgi:hypothetical protein